MRGCGWLALDDWLNGPVTKADRLADQRREQRLRALQGGETPA